MFAHEREEEAYRNTSRHERRGDSRKQGKHLHVPQSSRESKLRAFEQSGAYYDWDGEQKRKLRGGGTLQSAEPSRGNRRAAAGNAREHGYSLKNAC